MLAYLFFSVRLKHRIR